MLRTLFKILAGLIIISAFLIFSSAYRFNTKIDKHVSALKNKASSAKISEIDWQGVDTLPLPVRKYLRFSLKNRKNKISFIKLIHSGYFRTNMKQVWFPIYGEQYYTTKDPGFIWIGTIRVNALMWVKACDCFIQGKGSVLVKMISAFPVADVTSRETDISTLIRYYSEAPWFPTAFLPDKHIAWETVDDFTARALITYDDLKVALLYHFNNDGQIIKMTTEDRFRGEKRVAWTLYYKDYKELNGCIVPTLGIAEWNDEQSNFEYAKFNITSVTYDQTDSN